MGARIGIGFGTGRARRRAGAWDRAKDTLSSSVVLRCSTGVLLYLYRWFTCCVQVGWLVVKDSTNNSTG
jgi:hypothetical protein